MLKDYSVIIPYYYCLTKSISQKLSFFFLKDINPLSQPFSSNFIYFLFERKILPLEYLDSFSCAMFIFNILHFSKVFFFFVKCFVLYKWYINLIN